MRCCGMWCRGELCRVGLRVGLDDPKGFFQPERFWDSVKFIEAIVIVNMHAVRPHFP